MVEFKNINDAHNRISNFIHKTPILTNKSINNLIKSELFFKCENFQKAGSFKIRGATNAVQLLRETQLKRGIITTSSGNHGGALSMAASRRNTSIKVIMPKNSSLIKVENVKRYGGKIIWCDANQKSREDTLKKIVDESGEHVIHPYNDERIIAGQGTVAKELLEDISDLDIIITPVSGGGLLSGTLCSATHINPKLKIYGAEPKEADDALRSLQIGQIQSNKTTHTICDGLRAQIGTKTFPIIQSLVTDIITVTESEIINSMKLIWERMKIIVEPSASITLAAVLSKPKLFKNKKIGLILSGGNFDLHQIPWMK